jgi:hypothetical protein
LLVQCDAHASKSRAPARDRFRVKVFGHPYILQIFKLHSKGCEFLIEATLLHPHDRKGIAPTE